MAVDYQGGNDTILNYSGINNAFARNAARIAKQQQDEAARLAAEQKELTDIVKKVNTNGVQKVDIPEVNEKLNDVYDTYYKANKATDRGTRLSLRMDLEKKIEDMEQFVNISKDRGVQQVKLTDWVGNPNNMGLVSSDALTKIKQYSDLPTSKLPANAFSRDLYTSRDTSYLDKAIDLSAKNLLLNADKRRIAGRKYEEGNSILTDQYQLQQVPKDQFATDLYRQYNGDIKFKNTLDTVASQLGMTKDQYILNVVDEYDKASKLKQRTDLSPLSVSKGSKSGGGDGSTTGTVIDTNYDINYGSNSSKKTGTITARESFALPIGTTLSAGKFKMQDADGNTVANNNTTDEFKVARIATVPVLKSSATETQRKGGKVISSKTLKAGSIVTKDYAEKNPDKINYQKKAIIVKTDKGIGGLGDIKTTYFADPKEVIPRVKLTKAARGAYSVYEQEYDRQEAARGTKQPTTKTTTPTTKIKVGIAKGGNVR